MIRTIGFHACVASLRCLSGTVPNAGATADGQPNGMHDGMLPMTTTLSSGVSARSMLRQRTVDWEGKTYSPEEGIPVLMSVLLDSSAERAVRIGGYRKLKMIAHHVTGTPWVERLVSRYGDELSEEESNLLLECLIRAKDPRAFNLFVSVLERESNSVLRLYAAVGLGQWNVRRGVAELFTQLGLDEVLPGGSTIADQATKAIQDFNRTKAWGLPDQQIWRDIQSRGVLPENETRELYVAEIKKWFTENEHRFPDWKPGDPLPEVEPTEEPEPN